jgi:hypothetical protein
MERVIAKREQIKLDHGTNGSKSVKGGIAKLTQAQVRTII